MLTDEWNIVPRISITKIYSKDEKPQGKTIPIGSFINYLLPVF